MTPATGNPSCLPKGVLVNTYDPVSGLIATGRAYINTSGVGTEINRGNFIPRVELLADVQVVRTELSYPYELTTVVPRNVETGNQVVLQVRATDTGQQCSFLFESKTLMKNERGARDAKTRIYLKILFVFCCFFRELK